MIKRVKTNKFEQGYGWKVSFHRRGQKQVRRIFETRKLAQAVLDKLSGDAARRDYDLPVESGITLSDLIERHLAAMSKRGRDKTNTKRAETVLNRFAGVVGKDTMVEKIHRSDLRAYVETRLEPELVRDKKGDKKLKPPPQHQTINREMNEIMGCLSAARKTYYRALEDWQQPQGVWLEEPSDGRRQTWSDADFHKVIDELMQSQRKGEKNAHVEGRRDVGEMFIIIRRTGMRPVEVRTLRKNQVDFTNGIIIITSKKGMSEKRTARSREIPFDDEVADILKRRYIEAKGQYLFPGDDPHKPRSGYLQVFKSACERAKVPYGLNGEGSLVLYDARRTAENDMLEAGHSVRAVGDIFGHSAETMAKHYHRSTREQRRAAVESTKQSAHKMHTLEVETSHSSHFAENEKSRKATSGE